MRATFCEIQGLERFQTSEMTIHVTGKGVIQ